MLPELLMFIVWQSGFVSTQSSDINKLTKAVVVSIIEPISQRDLKGKLFTRDLT